MLNPPKFLRTKKSKILNEDIEITFVKSNTTFWPPEDESRKKKINQETELSYPSFSSLEVQYDNDSEISELSSISSFDGPIEDTYRKRRSYYDGVIKKRTRIEPSILNHFLDFLSACFWKCSTGCQQLPDKHH